MDLEYDQKFEEMKKYIPFLESMIKRLESTNTGTNNPRKAQLDKIRSLRDLLLDKKKKMKMENLLKCEQVLVNLYAKVEQRDSMADNKKSSTEQNQKDKSDLNTVRNKLKSVVSKLHDDPETLPEIARATNTEVDCTPGSKEPALFQRRPNKASPPREYPNNNKDGNSSMSKRPYTRVLMSPEPKKKGWRESENSTSAEKPLFSRRSPRRSPQRYSPSYKRERKKSSKQRSKSRQDTKDLNITLKVPEESLSSLNTKDILSRIINCSDSDVDIDTLRGLRSQILGELKQTGAKDDISDLILKSYKKKADNSKKKDDVEEGELSDSESETIENIYGSLVVVNKEENVSTNTTSSDKHQPRKIQICLVINSEKENETRKEHKLDASLDVTDFEPFTDENNKNKTDDSIKVTESKSKEERSQLKDKEKNDTKNQEEIKVDSPIKARDVKGKAECPVTASDIKQIALDKSKVESNKDSKENVLNALSEKSISQSQQQHQEKQSFKPNFYQPLIQEHNKSIELPEDKNSFKSSNVGQKSDSLTEHKGPTMSSNTSAKTKVKKDTVSEIDILQALKKEILGETVTTSNIEEITPPLHQPKVTKVSSTQEITSKKRISIENYKQKSIPTIKKPLFNSDKNLSTSKDDSTKKQSLKLTEKECERFNFSVSLPTAVSSDENDSILSIDDINESEVYGAPKSPDHEDFADSGIKPPVIIPSDPVKNIVVNTKADVDMRTLIKPQGSFGCHSKTMTSSLKGKETVLDSPNIEKSSIKENIPDARTKTESNQSVINEKSNSYLIKNSDRQTRPCGNYPSVSSSMVPSIPSTIPQLMTLNLAPCVAPTVSSNIVASANLTPILAPNMPLMNPSMTPNRTTPIIPGMTPMMTPIMTPNSRSYEVTPRPNFDDDFPTQKHVYAPMFPSFEHRDFTDNDINKMHQSHWEPNENSKWEDRNFRSSSSQRDMDYQRRRNDRYPTDSYNRMDSPQIRMDCPATPNPSFGRMESPMTPVHPYGRSECPMTPSHPFGRSDSNMTPTNVFGRSDFHRSTSMSGQKFNKSQDPRLNRSSEYDNYQVRNEDTNHSYFKGDYRRGKDRFYEHGSRSDRERVPYRETSIGRTLSRDYDTDGSYRNDNYRNDFRYRNEKPKGYEDFSRRRNQRARSISRMNPSEDSFSSPKESSDARKFARESSPEKLISVQSHTGRSFNIDTSFHRTFQETNIPSLNMSFDDRRRRASSVGRSLRDDTREETEYTRNKKTDVLDRNTPMHFRRACSVGRDLKDYNSNKDLKDIKADLRSYKFDSYKKLRDQNDRSKGEVSYTDVKQPSIPSNNNLERRNKQREWDVKTHKHDNSKYSPKRNYRDPRVRRDFKVDNTRDGKYTNKLKHEESSRSKNYGIVYSNDNIAKGTILASASGVRYFKIPKIKRPTEENEVDNVFKANEGNVSKKDEKKVDDVGNVRVKKGESKETKLETNSINTRNIRNNKEKLKLQDIKTTHKKKDEDEKQIDDLSSIDSSNSVSDNYEKRRTRSAKKSSGQTTQQETESPVRKARRIKKPLVYDSDSDSLSSSTSNSESIKKGIGKNKSLKNFETIDTKVVEINQNEKPKKELLSSLESTEIIEPKIVEKDKEKEKLLDKMQNDCAKINSINKKNTEILEMKSVIRNELCEEQNDSLDINFSVDDEMFNDNMASESVLDNINALIADLDNDIEAPKINDFNDRFIKNIVGSISSNDSPIPLEVNDPDFVPDMIVNNVKNTINSESGDQISDTNTSRECGNENENVKADTKKDTNENKNANNESLLKSKSNFPTMFHENNKKQDKQIENKNVTTETILQSKPDERTSEIEDNINNFNNDAIVSTTHTDEKAQEFLRDSELAIPETHKASNSFVPDSTYNSNDANTNKTLQETAPDSTNEVTPEMNSDITSTEISSDTLLKDQSIASSSSGGIDSIGKLLSILEDKSKIDQLLSYLSKDSSENEKIKKKLEKLREIVSDDEDNTPIHTKEDNENKEVISSNQSHQHIDNGECHSEKPKLDQKSEKLKSNKLEHIEQNVCEVTKNIDDKEYKSGIQDQNKDNVVQGSSGNVQQTSRLELQKTVMDDNIQNINQVNMDTEKQLESSTSNMNRTADIDQNLIFKETKESDKTKSTPAPVSTKKIVKKSKIAKRGKTKNKIVQNKEKRTTRSVMASTQLQVPPVPKKPSRELLKLQEDIREMFIKEDILNTTGIRMCRLAKMVDVDNSKADTQSCEAEPVVVLEKIKRKDISDEPLNETEKKSRTINNKPAVCNEIFVESKNIEKPKYKPGPKSKTKKDEKDPYVFDNDSVADSNNTVDSRDQNTDSESDSLASTKSFESSELLVEIKKKTKRKRRSWQLGVIRRKTAKKKLSKVEVEVKPSESSLLNETAQSEQKHDTQEEEKKISPRKIPDLNCFVDKKYCFHKNQNTYMCRLCEYSGNEIVLHYKKQHPHYEIPLSRLNPVIAKEAIKQCESMNLQAVSKIKTDKYCCRFCFTEFKKKKNSALETFFWHVVSAHTGEYKHLCSECINVKRCPFNLDIPPPPKNIFGQLIGYICSRCNYTQVSLENLKTHVILRHDDEQTEVYSINLAQISKTALQSPFVKPIQSNRNNQIDTPRTLRSTRSNQSLTEQSDDNSDITESSDHNSAGDTTHDKSTQDTNISAPKIIPKKKIQSKFSFENDDNVSDTSSYSKNDEIIKSGIKLEQDDENQVSHFDDAVDHVPDAVDHAPDAVDHAPDAVDHAPEESNTNTDAEVQNKDSSESQNTTFNDIMDYPHFKIKFSDTGTKEYICCINQNQHYQTTLIISLKRHVISRHKETWDGYCFVCKAIVMGLGVHEFKDCLQHYLDKHMDNFPTLEEIPIPTTNDDSKIETSTPVKNAPLPKPYINVRPLSELISAPEVNQIQEESSSMPKIQSVVSLLPPSELVQPDNEKTAIKVFKYEEAQEEIMSRKNRVVFETMLSPEKLINVFKCAGRFCSYTTDSAEDALVHVSTHKKVGGENSLKCAYCDFDAMDNAIDLVMHVFKSYSHCSYACSKCFYRASVSQLVYAHIKRAHSQFDADKIPVLSCATIVEDKTKDDILSRVEAVMYYICKNLDPDTGGICQFKSFVLTKFREHLHARHANDQEFICSICNDSTSSPKLLADHLKSHGLRIYQCCRCLFGADNETDLMDHASARHPLKQPKAYLRIITSKGPNSEVRVLPLAVLSKSSVQTTVITPRSAKENPVKEAERSIELEKLIGQTNFMIESMTSAANEVESTEVPSISMGSPMLENLLERESTMPFPTSVSSDVLPSTSASALPLLSDRNAVTGTNVTIKAESVDIPEKNDENSTLETAVPSDPDVVCLDSDDDSSRQVIDLSTEDNTELNQSRTEEEGSEVKIARYRIYKCSKCFCVCKTETMFKKHIASCFPKLDQISCLHCPFVGPFISFFNHTSKHLETSKRFGCTQCDEKFISKAVASKHMKRAHAMTMSTQNLVVVDPERKDRPKRKLSSEAVKSSEPAAKLKKYGPQDVDKLPINPILDDLVYCSICEFSTKVRLNMVRHLQLHAEQQPVPRTAPVNPVPNTNEKHFDKMVNLASSSISNKNDKTNPLTAVAVHLPPEAAAIYPKYVPPRHRYTCGAKDCSYISVNESMFKFHWETLHQGTNDYHCVHCPPHQHLDTSKPLTAVRIISHLKMHDVKLYACSSCSFYYHSRKIIEKHLKEVHSGNVLVVREEGSVLPPTPAPSSTPPASSAPTMDLKPWQCGLCKFKSMLRPEVIEHCGKFHQSKMQFKCTYCGFRTSNIENISKHQSKQHPGKKEEVFYFYYREGSIPNESDGLARWQKQSQKNESPEIKTEAIETPVSNPAPVLRQIAPKPVNLDIVKQELIEPLEVEATIEDLCKEFGQFCDPNGLKYKCSLCKVVFDDSRDAMQSHLYEELQYRKWGCGICSYKAFHKPGLHQHVNTEHTVKRGDNKEPIELQMNPRIEKWVAKLLEHQTTIIERNKENLAKQKAEILRPVPGSSVKVADKAPEAAKSDQSVEKSKDKPNVSMAELEKLFGPFGVPSNMNYSCPKCGTSSRTESVMQEHLESELNKIRWRCSNCNETFQTYHEAQFHCRSVHQGQSSRPVEATRDVNLRAAWVSSVLQVQKLSMNYMPVTESNPPEVQPQQSETSENSLLVVRYEEKVPTPEEQMRLNRKLDSDDDSLVIDETESSKAQPSQSTSNEPLVPFVCGICSALFKFERQLYNHMLKHYNLKPFQCPYCSFTNSKRQLESHIKTEHPHRMIITQPTVIPSTPPPYLLGGKQSDDEVVCLTCEKVMSSLAQITHFHGTEKPDFGIKDAVVYKCCLCLTLYPTVTSLKAHHKRFHPQCQPNYSFYKLHNENRMLSCDVCKEKFPLLADIRVHNETKHGIKLNISNQVVDASVIEIHDDNGSLKRKAMDKDILPAPKKVARKSTTKLPDVVSVARKSTTKLPYTAANDMEEYSYYGTKPSLDNLQNVTTDLPVFNKMVQFSMKDLGGIFKMNPIVLIEDIAKKKTS